MNIWKRIRSSIFAGLFAFHSIALAETTVPDPPAGSSVTREKLEELMQLNHRVVERIKMLQAMQAHVDMMAFNLGAKVSFDTDRARAMEDTKIWAALALSGEQKMGVEDPREMERLARTVEDVAHRRWLVSDDVEEHIEQIRPYLEWGFDHLVFHFPGNDQERAMALYAEKVLPELRSRFG